MLYQGAWSMILRVCEIVKNRDLTPHLRNYARMPHVEARGASLIAGFENKDFFIAG